MIPLTRPTSKAARLARREVPASEFIPYACHYNDETILTKSGDLVQFLRVEGFSSENADFDDIDFKKDRRNALFKSIASPRYALWFHTLRTRQPAYPSGEFAPGFARDLNELWRTRNQGRPLFQNRLFISIVRKGTGLNSYGFHKFLGSLLHGADPSERNVDLARDAQELTDVRRRFEAALADYGPHVLAIRRSPSGDVSEPLAHLSRLVNLEDRPVRVPTMDLSRYLATGRLFFGSNAIERRGAASSQLAAMLSIKDYGAETAAGMLDGFLRLPFEWVLTQSFIFSHRQTSLGKMQKQQRLMEKSEDPAVSQTEGISQALDDMMSGETAFGEHHLTLMPLAGSIEELNEAVAAAESELMNLGIMAVREDLNLEPCFWAQLPGNAAYIARRATVSTANLAGLASLHNFPSGRLAQNHWGPAVTVLETRSGTPYFFNFHKGDVGHTLVIGPTGSGKTVLVNFLCAQARKFKARLFFFDKDRGAEIFIRALGGSYSVLGGGAASGFNPLQLDESPANQAFMTEWLLSLTGAMGERSTSQDLSLISQAVKGSYTLAPQDRTLARIAPFLGLSGPDTLAGRLSPWHSNGAYGPLFGNDKDVLSLKGEVTGFEMGMILSDPKTLAPVLSYLFHRIQMVLDGTPTMIVLDEAWALLDNPLFAPKIRDWLKTLRKLNAFVVFATQSVEDAARSSISDTLVQQCATQIYFPNPKATESYRSVFKLSEREVQFIRASDPSDRCFLIKQGHDAVTAKLDLSGLPGILPVLSGRAETVLTCEEIRARVGDDPAVWLPPFQEVCRVQTQHHV